MIRLSRHGVVSPRRRYVRIRFTRFRRIFLRNPKILTLRDELFVFVVVVRSALGRRSLNENAKRTRYLRSANETVNVAFSYLYAKINLRTRTRLCKYKRNRYARSFKRKSS